MNFVAVLFFAALLCTRVRSSVRESKGRATERYKENIDESLMRERASVAQDHAGAVELSERRARDEKEKVPSLSRASAPRKEDARASLSRPAS